jgi:hypothetical protein
VILRPSSNLANRARPPPSQIVEDLRVESIAGKTPKEKAHIIFKKIIGISTSPHYWGKDFKCSLDDVFTTVLGEPFWYAKDRANLLA